MKIEGVVTVGQKDYEVIVGRDLLSTLPARIKALVPAAVYVIITDENVAACGYADTLRKGFEALNTKVCVRAVAPGEASKCRAVKAEVEDWMLEQHVNRDSCLIALGGGVVGDLGGFIAATYMRGLPYVQVPTSLLAMVDSSIGGKTGIDTPAGKNLVGAFHKPKAVFSDLSLIQTLPLRELCNGMAEAIKAGAIRDGALFELIENNADKVMKYDTTLLAKIVLRASAIKGHVVTVDFFEGDLRSSLNFGHSIGHAVEAYMQPGLLHGECISIGMIEESELALSMGYLKDKADIARLRNCLTAYRLPTEIPRHLTVKQLLGRMAVDKKNKNNIFKICMLKRIGELRVNPSTTSVHPKVLGSVLTRPRPRL